MAGPMERALRFLKSTSLNGGGVAETGGVAAGASLTGDELGVVAAAGEATGAGEVFASGRCCGSSWAGRGDVIQIDRNETQKIGSERERAIMVVGYI